MSDDDQKVAPASKPPQSQSVLRMRREVADNRSSNTASPTDPQQQQQTGPPPPINTKLPLTPSAANSPNTTTTPPTAAARHKQQQQQQQQQQVIHPALPGDIVGEYLIDREMGRGQFAVVYRAIPLDGASSSAADQREEEEQYQSGGSLVSSGLGGGAMSGPGATAAAAGAIALKIDLLPERQLGARTLLDDQQTNRNWRRVLREFPVAPVLPTAGLCTSEPGSASHNNKSGGSLFANLMSSADGTSAASGPGGYDPGNMMTPPDSPTTLSRAASSLLQSPANRNHNHTPMTHFNNWSRMASTPPASSGLSTPASTVPGSPNTQLWRHGPWSGPGSPRSESPAAVVALLPTTTKTATAGGRATGAGSSNNDDDDDNNNNDDGHGGGGGRSGIASGVESLGTSASVIGTPNHLQQPHAPQPSSQQQTPQSNLAAATSSAHSATNSTANTASPQASQQHSPQASVGFFQYHPRQTHPATNYIVKFLGDKLRTRSGHRAIELELLDGKTGDMKQTLATVKQKRFNEANTRALVFQLLLAICHCHRHRVAHRDIKLANLLHDGKGTIKLCDFGLSVHVPHPQPTVSRGGLQIVPHGKVRSAAGTPTFMPPEAFHVESSVGYDPFAADVWSVGITMYVCVTGRLPFVAKDYDTLVKAITDGAYPLPRNLSPAGLDFLTQLLTPDPTERPSAWAALQHAWFDGSGAGSGAGQRPSSQSPPSSTAAAVAQAQPQPQQGALASGSIGVARTTATTTAIHSLSGAGATTTASATAGPTKTTNATTASASGAGGSVALASASGATTLAALGLTSTGGGTFAASLSGSHNQGVITTTTTTTATTPIISTTGGPRLGLPPRREQISSPHYHHQGNANNNMFSTTGGSSGNPPPAPGSSGAPSAQHTPATIHHHNASPASTSPLPSPGKQQAPRKNPSFRLEGAKAPPPAPAENGK